MISTKQAISQRWIAASSAVLLATLILVGCSTGNAPEAQRAQQQDEQRTSIISDMQATHTWDLINGSPESTPETTPEP